MRGRQEKEEKGREDEIVMGIREKRRMEVKGREEIKMNEWKERKRERREKRMGL